MGIELGSDIVSRSLTMIRKESFSSTRDLTRRPNQAKRLLRGLTPTASK